MDVRAVGPSLFTSETTATSASGSAPEVGAGAAPGQVSFENVLVDAVADASRADSAATAKAAALASGAIDDLHGTMISLKEADISVKLVGTVRNKLLDAFQELWRTSV